MNVFIPGVWDMVHIGHVEALNLAKCGAGTLIVGVASDEVVLEDKGERPVIPLFHRMQMLMSLNMVDQVIPYYEFEFIQPIKVAKPDIVYLGNYQPEAQRYIDLFDHCYKNNIEVVMLPRNNLESTTEIKRRCQSI